MNELEELSKDERYRGIDDDFIYPFEALPSREYLEERSNRRLRDKAKDFPEDFWEGVKRAVTAPFSSNLNVIA